MNATDAAKKFWSFKTVDQVEGQPAEVDLLIYGVIGDDWWGDVCSAALAAEIAVNKDKQIHCRINSVGGEAFAGIAIHNMLKAHPGGCRCTVEGLAASAASVIAVAGKKTTMGLGAMMMIHPPSAWVAGDADDMRQTAGILDQIRDSLVSIYQAKTGKTPDELRTLIDAETWMSAQEAVDQGFADEAAGQVIVQNLGETVVYNGISFPAGQAPKAMTPRAVVKPQNAERVPCTATDCPCCENGDCMRSPDCPMTEMGGGATEGDTSARCPRPFSAEITRDLLANRAPQLLNVLLDEGRQKGIAESAAESPAAMSQAELRQHLDGVSLSVLAAVLNEEQQAQGFPGSSVAQPTAAPVALTRDLLAAQAPDLLAAVLQEGRRLARADVDETTKTALKQVSEAADLILAAKVEGRAEGAKAERERIQAIEANALPGHTALLVKAKYGVEAGDGQEAVSPLSAEAFAVALVQEEKAQRGQYLHDVATDAAQASVPGAAPPAGNSKARDEAELNRLIDVAVKATTGGK